MTALGSVIRAGRVERRRLTLGVVLGFGAVLASGGLLITSGYLISRAAQRPDILKLTVAITAVRAFAITRALLRYGERLASHDAALRMLGRIRARFYRRLAPLVPGDLGGPRSGDLLARFVGDVDALQDVYVRALAPPAIAALTIVAATFTAWLFLPAAAPVVFVALLVAATAVPALATAMAWRAGREQAGARAALTAELVEAIDGAPELAVAGRAAERVDRVRRSDAELARLAVRHALTGGATTAFGGLVAGLALIAMLLVAIPAVGSGALAGVLLASMVFLVLAAFEPISPLPAAAQRLRACAESANRLEELSSRKPTVTDPPQPLPAPRGEELSVDGISLSYDGAPVLHDVTFHLDAGEHIALLGPSGAGKTTLAHLLVRFRDVDAGCIAIDGADLRDLAQDDVRRTIAFSAQDAQLFNTTVRQNVLIGRPDAEDAAVWEALYKAGAGEFVADLPDGLDTIVGQDGDLLSGGQRQRVALARALLSEARFLVLDEPTAHLDPETARDVMSALPARAGERGLLVITHSDVGLDEFDAVYELRDGTLTAT